MMSAPSYLPGAWSVGCAITVKEQVSPGDRNTPAPGPVSGQASRKVAEFQVNSEKPKTLITLKSTGSLPMLVIENVRSRVSPRATAPKWMTGGATRSPGRAKESGGVATLAGTMTTAASTAARTMAQRILFSPFLRRCRNEYAPPGWRMELKKRSIGDAAGASGLSRLPSGSPVRSTRPMRHLVTVGLVSAFLSALLVASAAAAVAPKPKPWQWKPEKVVLRLTAAKPIVGGEVGSDILAAQCTPVGKGVARRLSRFTCVTKWGGSNGNYTSTLTLRILPLGSGKLCVVTTTNNSGEIVAVPHPAGRAGTRIQPQWACPAA